jgi:23S rRNA (guanosine2251-2'-O)-methyltransferase
MPYIKGKHAVLQALLSDTEVDRVSISFSVQHSPDLKPIFNAAKSRRIKIQVLSKQAFDRLNEPHSQGVLAYIPDIKSSDISELLHNPDDYPIIVMLDHIEDPHNMGAILRTCEALGIKAIVYPKDRQCQVSPTVLKVASGAASFLKLIKVTNLAQTVDMMKKAGYWIYGSDDSAPDVLDTFKPNFPCVIIMGNEGKGLSPLLAKKTDATLQIPLTGKTSSLNVSVASGIILYAVTRHLNT